MDYEKAYKDLMRDIDIAIEGQNDGETKVVLQNIKERNIESEDEKFARIVLDLPFKHEVDYKFVRAYLEKQKESLYRDKIDQHIKEILDGTYKMREHLYECSKSLKQKEQKPAEWSEEDERRYISCLQRLGTGNPNQPETINSKWFKEHVSPQPHWKPSEEQMNALKHCVNGWQDTADGTLESLYNDLLNLFKEL